MEKKGNILIGGIAIVLTVALIAFYLQSESTKEFFEGFSALLQKYPLEAMIPFLFFLVIIASGFVLSIHYAVKLSKMDKKSEEKKVVKNVKRSERPSITNTL